MTKYVTKLRYAWETSTASWPLDDAHIRIILRVIGAAAGFFTVIAAGMWSLYTPRTFPFILTGTFIAITTVGAYAWLKASSTPARASLVSVLLGVLLVGMVGFLVFLTGAVNSSLMMGFPLLIIWAGLMSTPRIGLTVMIASIVMLNSLMIATYYEFIPYAPAIPYTRPTSAEIPHEWSNMVLADLIHVFVHIATSYIAVGLRNRELEVRRLDALKSKYLGIVSHDLRTPITSIRAFAGILEEEATDTHKEFSRTIAHEADRLHRLVTDLLDLDKIEAGKMEWHLVPMNVTPVLANAAEVFGAAAQDKGVTLTTDIAADLPIIAADADRISQLLANLLNNAIKFTPAGGAVTLSASSNARTLTMAVSDTGPGIPEDALATIFDRFAQTETGQAGGGTGLGLSIAREIIHAHGGEIDVTSELGTGTTFSVEIPVAH